MDPRFLAARLSSSFINKTLRLSGGGGTAAPGLVAECIDPQSLKKLTKYVSDIVIVTGTNGKTTTSRIIGSALAKNGTSYIHNREGSNLLRGLIGSLIAKTPFFPGSKKPLALLEVDEATLPPVVAQTTLRIIVITNLFRDQLDRYGEVDSIRKTWRKALQNLDQNTTLVLNSDDPSVAHLGKNTRAKVVYFGVEDKRHSLQALPHAADFVNCIVCGNELKYETIYISHLGKYKCPSCGEERPSPGFYAKKIELLDEYSFKATIITPKDLLVVKMQLPGLYNVYNCLAAVAAAVSLNIPVTKIIQALKGYQAAFGRTESIDVAGKKVYLALAKNPTGFNELLRTIFSGNEKKHVLIIINDLIADGRDVSWLWDVDFELLKDKTEKVWVAGLRAADMGLRLKYAGIETEGFNSNIKEALDSAYTNIPPKETLFVLPTYTAMLETKKILAEKGYGRQFWED